MRYRVRTKIKFICSVFIIFFLLFSTSVDVFSESLKENEKSRLISSENNYKRYYRNFTNENLQVSLSDEVFSILELRELLAIASDDLTKEIIETNINKMPNEFANEVIKRSGLLIRDRKTNKDINDLTILVKYTDITLDKNLIKAQFDFQIKDLEVKFLMFSPIPEKEKVIVNTSNDKSKNLQNTVINKIKLKNNQITVKSLGKDIAAGNSSNINIANEKPVVNKSTIKVIDYPLKNIIKSIPFIKSFDVGVNEFDLSFFITHSYLISGGLGCIIFIYILVSSISAFNVYRWYRKGKEEVFNEILSEINDYR